MNEITLILAVILCFGYVRAFHSPFAFSIRSRKVNVLSMEFDWKSVKKSTEGKMAKSVDSFQSQLNTLRVGAATPSLLDRVMVEYFGAPTPLAQVARVSTSGAMQLIVEPFDNSVIKEIEKAILTSDLNLTPNNDGILIRINLPPLTEERRKDLAKQAHIVCETGKVSIRNIRRDLLEKIKGAEKSKDIGKDDCKACQVLYTNTTTYINIFIRM